MYVHCTCCIRTYIELVGQKDEQGLWWELEVGDDGDEVALQLELRVGQLLGLGLTEEPKPGPLGRKEVFVDVVALHQLGGRERGEGGKEGRREGVREGKEGERDGGREGS